MNLTTRTLPPDISIAQWRAYDQAPGRLLLLFG